MYRYILREYCSQFDSLPLTSSGCLRVYNALSYSKVLCCTPEVGSPPLRIDYNYGYHLLIDTTRACAHSSRVAVA
jgi:hypothetical protein